MRRMHRSTAMVLAILGATAIVQADEPAVRMTVDPMVATIGDHLSATLVVELPGGASFDPPDLEDSLGKLSILSGRWSEQPGGEETGGTVWTWQGTVAAYETGEIELPPIRIEAVDNEREIGLETPPLRISIHSVLEPESSSEEPPEPADINDPASIEPEYGALWTALGSLAALLAVAALIWWLHRRYADRLAAAEPPDDPFRRMPPHVWAYQRLQALLDQGLGHDRSVDRFYEELSRILRTYLAGRYRTDLLEHTTVEIPGLLKQAGAPGKPIDEIERFLQRCDMVKFAKESPDPDACRGSVEEAYRIVDATKPVESSIPTEREGAA